MKKNQLGRLFLAIGLMVSCSTVHDVKYEYENVLIFDYPVDEVSYIPGSYNGRSFYFNERHIGEDILLSEKTPIRAIADGKIVWYKFAKGYATVDDGTSIVAVIEHDLGSFLTFQFKIGHTKTSTVNKICSIYGHIRKSAVYDGPQLQWQVGQNIKRGQVIGYVNDADHNGHGTEHLHMGIRLGGNFNRWSYYGYENPMIPDSNVSNFASAKEIIDLAFSLKGG